MSKLVQNQYDMNCYDSQICLNLFRINMIRIDTILKHVKTRNENMTKYSKIWVNGTWNVLHWRRQSDSLDRCEQVERSKREGQSYLTANPRHSLGKGHWQWITPTRTQSQRPVLLCIAGLAITDTSSKPWTSGFFPSCHRVTLRWKFLPSTYLSTNHRRDTAELSDNWLKEKHKVRIFM